MQPGDALGPYRIERPLGEGGMGQVWLATDPRLQRSVAIKVLPDAFADDPDRLERFEREARAAAALNHPHIAAVYDVGKEGERHFIVQEFLSGESLGDRLAGGRLPVPLALGLGIEIARALGAAHAAGIVHRDLKPDNLFVGPDGHAKVLDFGLAKEVRPGRARSGSGLSRTPTSPTPTGERMVGSVGYMAPEQIEGAEVDQRADLFALGCVLQEMLTGRHPFRGRSIHQTIDRVLHDEPESLAEIAPELPPMVRWVLAKCLAKSPDDRYQTADDLAVDLRRGLIAWNEGERGAATAGQAARAKAIPLPVGVLGAVVLALLAAWAGSGLRPAEAPPPAETSRFFLNLPSGLQLALSDMRPLAVSPDGRTLAYVVLQAGTTQIHIRDRSRFGSTPIAGTEGGSNPFFSPDGQWLGFVAGGRLRKVALAGGAPVGLAEVSFQPRGASWGSNGRIVFSSSGGAGLAFVDQEGGDVVTLTTPDLAAGESHRWPHVLPDARAILFTAGSAEASSFDDAQIAVLMLDGTVRTLLQGTSPMYVPTGHIVFVRAGALHAAPFDLETLQITGSPTPMIEGIASRPMSGAAYYTLSDNGTLAYVAGFGVAARALVWVDRQGREQALSTERRAFDTPRLSPDGRRIAVTIQPEGGTPDVWVYDLTRGTTTRLTYEGMNGFPVWSPDGTRVAFTSNRSGPFNLFWKAADGSDAAQLLLASDNPLYPDSWSRDGSTIAYTEDHPETVSDVWVLNTASGAPAPRALVQRPFTEGGSAFSADGRWLAYVSDETGREEVYVRAFTGETARWQVSTDGGSEPVWNPDGSELFYRSGRSLMAVPIAGTSSLEIGTPVRLFEGPYASGAGSANYDVAADGRRFLMVRSESSTAPTLINVVLDWFPEIVAASTPVR